MHLSRTALVALVAATTSALPVNDKSQPEQRNRHHTMEQQPQQLPGGAGYGQTEYQGQGNEDMHNTRSVSPAAVVDTRVMGDAEMSKIASTSLEAGPKGGFPQESGVNKCCVIPPEGHAAMPWASKDADVEPGFETSLSAGQLRQSDYIASRQYRRSGSMPPLINNFVDSLKPGHETIQSSITDGRGSTQNIDYNLRSLIGFPAGQDQSQEQELFQKQQQPPTDQSLLERPQMQPLNQDRVIQGGQGQGSLTQRAAPDHMEQQPGQQGTGVQLQSMVDYSPGKPQQGGASQMEASAPGYINWDLQQQASQGWQGRDQLPSQSNQVISGGKGQEQSLLEQPTGQGQSQVMARDMVKGGNKPGMIEAAQPFRGGQGDVLSQSGQGQDPRWQQSLSEGGERQGLREGQLYQGQRGQGQQGTKQASQPAGVHGGTVDFQIEDPL